MKLIDITGRRFGRLTVLAIWPARNRCKSRKIQRTIYWLCRCDCGVELPVRGHSLSFGRTRSCGCLRPPRTHGMAGSRIYAIWKSMRQRCSNPNHVAYPNYGGRRISVCERWLKFENFYADMSDPPPGKWLDRRDNEGNYEPDNCRWTTPTQARNRRPPKRKRRRSNLAEIEAYAASLARAA